MKEELLIEGEHIITKSDKSKITLTNKRLRYFESSSGKGYIMSVLLNKISHIEVKHTSYPILVILALLVAGAGIGIGVSENQESAMVAGLIVAGVLLLLYLFLRKHAIQVTSDGGGRMHFYTRGMKSEQVLKFVNQVEEAMIKL